MNKINILRNQIINFLGDLTKNDKIKTKLRNICGKTAMYDVPNELYQKRTSRKNRSLISWNAVKQNNITYEQLNSFEGGIVVDFINNDFFDNDNYKNETFKKLINRIGSDENVSAIISIRNENGKSSSNIQRDAFNKLVNNTKVLYKNNLVILNLENYNQYAITQTKSGGSGNDCWSGFLFISIKGGQQDTIETHRGKQFTLFNPACEMANSDICLDIDFTLIFFLMHAVNKKILTPNELKKYDYYYNKVSELLNESVYNNETYQGNLLDYCLNHPSLKIKDGELYDPILVEKINLNDFNIDDKSDLKSIDLTHDEAVFYNKFYWDNEKKQLLSPCRPTNIFWSRHLSNMMQQNFSLNCYFELEEKRVEKRKQLLK